MKPIVNCMQFKKDIENLLPDKIHYGCGKKIFNGWLNVDSFDESYPDGYIDPELAKNIFYCDLVQKHPFPQTILPSVLVRIFSNIWIRLTP